MMRYRVTVKAGAIYGARGDAEFEGFTMQYVDYMRIHHW
jgi:hypothetical protein